MLGEVQEKLGNASGADDEIEVDAVESKGWMSAKRHWVGRWDPIPSHPNPHWDGGILPGLAPLVFSLIIKPCSLTSLLLVVRSGLQKCARLLWPFP